MGNPVPSQIGLITTILFVGGFMGALVTSLTADYFGRRVGMLIRASLTLTSTVIQIAAQNSNIFIGGRLVIGVGITFTCVTGPSLLFELARPSMRGTIASLFNFLCYVGSIIAAWTTCGTGHLPTSWAWRIPSLIQGVPALLVMTSVLAGLPVSSRWLCANGRLEETQKLLAMYHGHGDPSSELMTQEIAEIQTTFKVQRQAKSSGQSSW
ncbi:general substrate transporter [Aspergillus transmontanensis]|uniref:General substrate transporter n=1 Tax=Aspergillus transmontanensis TaxID=1034304 RepID=A0A5N6W3Y1_9EURO|nr:general substrate transporter [Aspergillus transmontanensis]